MIAPAVRHASPAAPQRAITGPSRGLVEPSRMRAPVLAWDTEKTAGIVALRMCAPKDVVAMGDEKVLPGREQIEAELADLFANGVVHLWRKVMHVRSFPQATLHRLFVRVENTHEYVCAGKRAFGLREGDEEAC